MNKILSVVLFLLVSTTANAQESYSNIENIVLKSLNRYPKDSKNYQIGSIIMSNFNTAKITSTSLIRKINTGICVGLNDDDMYNTIYPARFYGTNDGLDISALKVRYSDGLSEDMKEYVHQYLHNFSGVGRTQTFKDLVQDRPKKLELTYYNGNEHILNEGYTLAFIRADKDWVYVISIDKNYRKQSYPSIITYAFKINPSGTDIFKTQGTKNVTKEKRSTE